jgi:hypothetical protein
MLQVLRARARVVSNNNDTPERDLAFGADGLNRDGRPQGHPCGQIDQLLRICRRVS